MWRWAMITEKSQYILSRGCGIISRRFLTLESSEKFRAPGENQTHDPLSSSSDTLATELLDALWRAGWKFNYNYTSHERDEDSCLIIQCRSMGRASPPPQKKKIDRHVLFGQRPRPSRCSSVESVHFSSIKPENYLFMASTKKNWAGIKQGVLLKWEINALERLKMLFQRP